MIRVRFATGIVLEYDTCEHIKNIGDGFLTLCNKDDVVIAIVSGTVVLEEDPATEPRVIMPLGRIGVPEE